MLDKLIYVDACVFIAHFAEETSHGDTVTDALEELVNGLDTQKVTVATSVITRVEVLPHRLRPAKAEQFSRWLLRSNVVEISIDHRIIAKAREVRGDLLQHAQPLKLKTPDALHVATALIYKLPTLYTLDKDIIRLEDHPYLATLPLVVTRPVAGPQARLRFAPRRRRKNSAAGRR